MTTAMLIKENNYLGQVTIALFVLIMAGSMVEQKESSQTFISRSPGSRKKDWVTGPGLSF